MEKKDLEIKVRNIIAVELATNLQDVTQDSKLAEDLGVDSLDLVELVMMFEDEFDIEIQDEDAEKWKTVKDVTDYLLQKVN